jgi:hypothetical protein
MTTAVALSPVGIQQFFNNLGQPNIGGSILTQVGGVNYATYQDSAGTTPLPNPIPLNSRGEISNSSGTSCQLFLQQGVVYTFTLYDFAGNQLNQATYVAPPTSPYSIVSSVSALRAVSKLVYSTVQTTGYYTAGDGGGAYYWYNAADTTSGDNGGSIIVASDGGRWYLIPQEWINPLQWGAYNTASIANATTTTNAIQACFTYIASIQNGQQVYPNVTIAGVMFPQGNFYINSAINVYGYVSIIGVGDGEFIASTIHQMTGGANIFNFYGETHYNTGVSANVNGINFEFDKTINTSLTITGVGGLVLTTSSSTANLLPGMAVVQGGVSSTITAVGGSSITVASGSFTNGTVVVNGTANGYALNFPKVNPSAPGTNLSVASLYIKNNRMGGAHAQGCFLYVQTGNDLEITGNCVDVCANGYEAIKLGDATQVTATITGVSGQVLSLASTTGMAAGNLVIQGSVISRIVSLVTNTSITVASGTFSASTLQVITGGPCNDVRISQNEFFYCYTPIGIHCGNNITIHGNTFSQQFQPVTPGTFGWVQISLQSNVGTYTSGAITNVVVANNSFWQSQRVLQFDGSVVNSSFTGNTMYQCWGWPLYSVQATNYQRWQISGNTAHLDNTFATNTSNSPYGFVEFTGGGVLIDSVVADNIVDANNNNFITAICDDNSGTSSWLGKGCTWRNNQIRNNTSYPGAHLALLPVTAKELVLENQSITAAGYPAGVGMLTFILPASATTIVNFEFSWEVNVIKGAGGNASALATGSNKVTIAATGTTPTITYQITAIETQVKADWASTGAGIWPTVTFVVTANQLQITVSDAGEGTPTNTVVNFKAYNFRAAPTSLGYVRST